MYKSVRILAIVAAAAALLTYASWLYPDALATVPIRSAIQLIVFFWTSVAALLASAVIYRTQTRSTLIILLVAVLLLLRPGLTAVTFTIWAFRGFAP
jgi:hypothetical protein